MKSLSDCGCQLEFACANLRLTSDGVEAVHNQQQRSILVQLTPPDRHTDGRSPRTLLGTTTVDNSGHPTLSSYISYSYPQRVLLNPENLIPHPSKRLCVVPVQSPF